MCVIHIDVYYLIDVIRGIVFVAIRCTPTKILYTFCNVKPVCLADDDVINYSTG